MSQATRAKGWGRFFRPRVLVPVAVVIVLVVAWRLRSGGEETSPNGAAGATYTLKRGNIPITVIEGGSAESQEPLYIKNEVKGRETKIVSLIEEGHRITKEDIEKNLVIVKLDAGELEERQRQQEIEYQQAKADLSEARQKLQIQQEDNTSEIKKAERDVKFKGMEVKKYIGEPLAEVLVAELTRQRVALGAAEKARERAALLKETELDATLKQEAYDRALKEAQDKAAKLAEIRAEEKARTKNSSKKLEPVPSASSEGEGEPAPPPASLELEPKDKEEVDKLKAENDEAQQRKQTLTSELEAAKAVFETEARNAEASIVDQEAFILTFKPIDFLSLAKDNRLGGEAEQKRTTQLSEILLEEEELTTAKQELEGNEKLFKSDFVTETDVIKARMSVRRRESNLASKKSTSDLFFQYEFPKMAEEKYSEFEEALRVLDRTRKETDTKLVNAKVSSDASLARFKVQEESRKDLQEQLDKCTITAEVEGLVVYGGEEQYWRQDPIREGTAVWENQTILTIPDITKMAITVQVHESAIKQIKKGQRARISVEAFPNEELVGEVMKVSVLPDSENRWMNPDLKVYKTTIAIDGTYDWLKPGMTAEVEIFVTELKNVLYVPVQAVTTEKEDHIVFLSSGEKRKVETGQFNDLYVEIKTGLDEGDEVLLRPLESDSDPDAAGKDKDWDGFESDETEDAGDTEATEEAPAVDAAPGPPDA
ncbi:MAG: efflux RND transporter periplasmic adaptor subunit [Candidatus Hydrogenedentes bacterium]|nr:efflux RND transporter periplasmic adaptor subunit [Candidatus Hydrogenedentota bacterium]